VFDFVITVPDYPRHVVGRDNLIELYRGYGSVFVLDRCYDLRVHHSPSTSTVVLEYSSEGKVVATGHPYGNRYISVVTIKDRTVAQWRDYLDPLRVFAALEGRPFEPSA
jgi:ketosteroid isomerase-like protein